MKPTARPNPWTAPLPVLATRARDPRPRTPRNSSAWTAAVPSVTVQNVKR